MTDLVRAYWPAALAALVILLISLRFVDPAPPRSLRLAAGPEDGAYYAHAVRYRDILARDGVDVEVRATAGSTDNLALLKDEAVDAALLQGGVASTDDGADLRSLGGLFQEPFWVFVREDGPVAAFADLKTRRLAIGPDGSGTRALALDLQAEWGADWAEDARRPIGGQSAAAALIAGDLDAAAFVASVDAPYVQALLANPGFRPLAIGRSRALARRLPGLAAIELPRGLFDIGADVPNADTPLPAAVAELAVHEDLHPAIQSILLEAAAQIHRERSLLAPAGAFPDGDLAGLPLSSQAQRYYERGPSALRRWFSFEVANFLDRAWVLLIPILTLLIPLARAAPPIYRWRVRRRIYVWYSDLRDLEARGRAASTDAERTLVSQQLRALQHEVGQVEVPLSYTDDLYRLRNHIDFVEALIEKRSASKADAIATAAS